MCLFHTVGSTSTATTAASTTAMTTVRGSCDVILSWLHGLALHHFLLLQPEPLYLLHRKYSPPVQSPDRHCHYRSVHHHCHFLLGYQLQDLSRAKTAGPTITQKVRISNTEGEPNPSPLYSQTHSILIYIIFCVISLIQRIEWGGSYDPPWVELV